MDTADRLSKMTEDLKWCNQQLREIFEMVRIALAQKNKTIKKLTAERDRLKKRLEAKK